MKPSFVLVLLLTDAGLGLFNKKSTGDQSCGNDKQSRVQIESVQRGKLCGGSLLKPRWVITASHCAEQEVFVRLSGTNKALSFIKGNSKKEEQKIPVNQQFTFRDENGNAHDLMLIKLNEDMTGSTSAISLPPGTCEKLKDGTSVQIRGVGATKKGEKPGRGQKCVTTEIAECGENDHLDCKYPSGESKICAQKPAAEFCYGDSGSAVEHDGYLHGVLVSDPVDQCVARIVILDICSYVEWILKTMKEH